MRRILLLQDRSTRSDSELGLRDWKIMRADSADSAERVLARAPVRVGLIALHALKPPPWWVETVLASYKSVRWIALVDREALHNPVTRRLIARRCHDFHTRPIESDRLQWTIGHAYGIGGLTEPLGTDAASAQAPDPFGESPSMAALRRHADRFAATDAPIMITGESGVGKELVARYVHTHSKRQGQPFGVINCAAIPIDLMQTELFGYERGAFTGANERKIGRIESAEGGTLFFDEVGALPLSQQATLLRFLEESAIVRVGGHRVIKADVRIIAATNRSLEQGVAEGWFRHDLFHRLNVLYLRVPSLRERREDIAALAVKFVDECAREMGIARRLSPRTLDLLVANDWPGNVRELRNRIRRAVLLSERESLQPADLGMDTLHDGRVPQAISLDEARVAAERSAVREALRQCNGNLSMAARALGISRMTLYRLLRRLNARVRN